jgi:uncharacterized LabA/DUF88 family protein
LTTGDRPRAVVYIDGFNFYYAAYADGEFGDYKWLDLCRFCDDLLPKLDIVAVRYFTARVKPLPYDPENYRRQDAYLRALLTLPRLYVHLGLFRQHVVPARLAEPAGNLPALARVRVHRSEEKGSDVNLASYMLSDGFRNRYDVAVVVSDDSDLHEPVRMVRDELGKKVGIVRVVRYRKDPRTGKRVQRGSVFRDKVDFIKDVRRRHFVNAQLPPVVALGNGKTVACPAAWRP